MGQPPMGQQLAAASWSYGPNGGQGASCYVELRGEQYLVVTAVACPTQIARVLQVMDLDDVAGADCYRRWKFHIRARSGQSMYLVVTQGGEQLAKALHTALESRGVALRDVTKPLPLCSKGLPSEPIEPSPSIKKFGRRPSLAPILRVGHALLLGARGLLPSTLAALTAHYAGDVIAYRSLLRYRAQEEVPGNEPEDADDSPKIDLMENERVTAQRGFVADSRCQQLIPKGAQGTVVAIDDDGDARIKFKGIKFAVWVFKSNFSNVKAAASVVGGIQYDDDTDQTSRPYVTYPPVTLRRLQRSHTLPSTLHSGARPGVP